MTWRWWTPFKLKLASLPNGVLQLVSAQIFTMVEALAVVSTIVGLVGFGSKVLHRLNDFQSIPETFKHVKDELPILLETLHQTKVAVEKGSIKEETKKALLLVVNGCQMQITLLDNLIARSLPQEEDSWRKKASKAIFSIRQDAKVNKITAILRTHIQSLTYYHAATSSTSQTANGMTVYLHRQRWTNYL
jgi:NACHT NTPase-like protein